MADRFFPRPLEFLPIQRGYAAIQSLGSNANSRETDHGPVGQSLLLQNQKEITLIKYLRPKAACNVLGIGLTTFWNLAKTDPDFPELIKLGPQTTVVEEAALITYVNSKRRPATARSAVQEAVPA